MITRRQSMQGGLAAAATLSLPAPAVWAQGKPMVKVRYNEVVRSILYAPAYVAISKGFLKEAGIDAEMTTAQGGDKSMAALLGGAADIALMGPETAVYILNGESPVKARIFCGLTATDGFMLLSREKQAKFEWSSLKGKEILGFRPGSTPLLYLEAALRKNGIDPLKDAKLNNNVAIPARVGSWLAGQNQFGIFIEPDAAQLEIDGKGFFCASIGETVGPADYTAFMATDTYLKANPAVAQSWTDAIAKAMAIPIGRRMKTSRASSRHAFSIGRLWTDGTTIPRSRETREGHRGGLSSPRLEWLARGQSGRHDRLLTTLDARGIARIGGCRRRVS